MPSEDFVYSCPRLKRNPWHEGPNTLLQVNQEVGRGPTALVSNCEDRQRQAKPIKVHNMMRATRGQQGHAGEMARQSPGLGPFRMATGTNTANAAITTHQQPRWVPACP